MVRCPSREQERRGLVLTFSGGVIPVTGILVAIPCQASGVVGSVVALVCPVSNILGLGDIARLVCNGCLLVDAHTSV